MNEELFDEEEDALDSVRGFKKIRNKQRKEKTFFKKEKDEFSVSRRENRIKNNKRKDLTNE